VAWKEKETKNKTTSPFASERKKALTFQEGVEERMMEKGV